jgi:hypothetical protein
MKCNETIGKWCKNNHGASKIIDTLEMYHGPFFSRILTPAASSPMIIKHVKTEETPYVSSLNIKYINE